MRVLISWIGLTDLRAAGALPSRQDAGDGPIAEALKSRDWDELLLISNSTKKETRTFTKWLKSRTSAAIHVHHVDLTSPTNFAEIYEAAKAAIAQALKKHGKDVRLTYHLSPGTPAMAAVWIILGKTLYPAELIQTSPQKGLEVAQVPFDITVDLIPELLRSPDDRLVRLAEGLPPESPEFKKILHRSTSMKAAIAKARRAAVRSVPVLIEGESGTGKEMFARAIHAESPRGRKGIYAINCGALPENLLESELFGHVKGAFTGATAAKKGLFEEANGGTLFLDEVGEMPASMQAKVLRALQEGKIRPVGATTERAVDIRVIAATNRNLIEAVRRGEFREDLFYRLAVLRLALPPLRERAGDVALLLGEKFDEINQPSPAEPGFIPKTLSGPARSALLAHDWPGNVRELVNTLQRLVAWTPTATITVRDVRDALLPALAPQEDRVLDRSLGDGFDIQKVIREVAQHYLERAMADANQVKTGAARLLGLPSYQTLTNWLRRYGVE